MTTILILLSPGIAAFFVFMAIHIIVWHFSFIKEKGVFLLAKIAFASYLFTFLLAIPASDLMPPQHYWLSLPFYFFLIMLYFHFYVGFDRSISIRILGDLVASPHNAMKLELIQSRHSPTSMLQPRLDDLVAHNWLKEERGVYRCTEKGVLLAKATLVVQKLYRFDNTG